MLLIQDYFGMTMFQDVKLTLIAFVSKCCIETVMFIPISRYSMDTDVTF